MLLSEERLRTDLGTDAPRQAQILFLPHFEPIQGSEFRSILVELDPSCVVRAGGLIPQYSNRLQLYVWWWPRLLLYGAGPALRALVGGPCPAVVVAWSHLVLVPWLIVGALLGRKAPMLVLVGFIYNSNVNRSLHSLKRGYLRFVLSRTERIITHSRHESMEYPRVFQLPKSRFTFVPCAAYLGLLPDVSTHEPRRLVAAGRSNRDYALLVKAMDSIPLELRIICDGTHLEVKKADPKRITVVHRCYGADYVRELAAAFCVVLPLEDDGISAAQMVMLHAMMLAKPIIVTRTAGTVDYVENGSNGLIVERGSSSALSEAMRFLCENPEAARQLGLNARKCFEARHTLSQFLRAVLNVAQACSNADGNNRASSGAKGTDEGS